MGTQTKVVEYKRRRDYERAANKMSRQGWTVQSVVDGHPMGGYWRRAFRGELGFGFLRHRLIVTYTREAP